VTVPLPASAGATEDDATRLRLTLLLEDNIEVALHAYSGRLWARVSTQIYNDTADVMWLGEAVARRSR
jgi:isopenicillin-N epimerase